MTWQPTFHKVPTPEVKANIGWSNQTSSNHVPSIRSAITTPFSLEVPLDRFTGPKADACCKELILNVIAGDFVLEAECLVNLLCGKNSIPVIWWRRGDLEVSRRHFLAKWATKLPQSTGQLLTRSWSIMRMVEKLPANLLCVFFTGMLDSNPSQYLEIAPLHLQNL